MTATATFENTTAGSENQALLRCPGLGQFRTSAFRVLRLSPAATAKEAVWQCDKTLARVRMGIPLPDPDPAPWLPSADPIEIQEAARTIESPLARIVEQLLWFDPDDENHASLIEALTTADHERLRAYLTASQSSSVAHRVSDANLRLLLGFSRLHEVGPVLVEPASAAPGAKLVRQNRSGPAIVENPHALLRAPVTREVGLATWHGLLGHAVASWGMLLCSPDFVEHVRVKIAALGDELLTDDDLEAVLSGLRTRIMGVRLPERKGGTAATIIPSVGCPMGCNFCTTSAFFGGKGKFINFYQTGDELFDVMCQAEDKLKVNSFFMMDENFLLHRPRALRLLQRMKEAGKSWTMAVFASANAIHKYSMQELVELGVTWIWMGLESPRSSYAKLHGADTRQLTHELQAHGIRVQGNGCQGRTRDGAYGVRRDQGRDRQRSAWKSHGLARQDTPRRGGHPV